MSGWGIVELCLAIIGGLTVSVIAARLVVDWICKVNRFDSRLN